MSNYKVTDECIACQACVEVAKDNFKMGSNGLAYVYKQPKDNSQEEECDKAVEICPVGAIEKQGGGTVEYKIATPENEAKVVPVLASSNIKEILDKYPQLKDVIVDMSPKFKKLLNPVMYNTLARFATFNDAARISGISVCEILHKLNDVLGTTEKLFKEAPECIKDTENINIQDFSNAIVWNESAERYIYNHDSMTEIIDKVSKLKPQENIVIISVDEPIELVKAVAGLGFLMNIEKNREYRVSIFNPQEVVYTNWKERKENFEQLDVRTMQTDPFDIIIQKAYATPEDDGFILIQRFEPYPMINMLAEMGFEHVTKKYSEQEVWVYFYKTPVEDSDEDVKSDKTEVVIQSATPVAYPVIMRLLQSDVIRKKIAIKELKVWEETEKHLAWITSGRADISFSAVITASKLKNSDVKIPALFVWDNFVILTRYKATDFNDLKGKEIHTPLFEEAPPTKITKYLIQANGLNPDDYKFVYGNPFGRPEKIYSDFVTGIADTVILREPEASYAIKIMQDRGEEVSVLSYNEMWNKINPGFGSFPNAGIVFKGEFVRNNPELAEAFLDELKEAINWVNTHRTDAAKLAFDMMRQPVDRIELFLDRVNFDYVSGDALVTKVKSYFDVLIKEGIVEDKLDETFFDIFR